MEIKKAKLIEYAYPTSSHAEKQGYGKTGCWFVSLYQSETSLKRSGILKHFLTVGEAEEFADKQPEPYHFMHKYHNN